MVGLINFGKYQLCKDLRQKDYGIMSPFLLQSNCQFHIIVIVSSTVTSCFFCLLIQGRAIAKIHQNSGPAFKFSRYKGASMFLLFIQSLSCGCQCPLCSGGCNVCFITRDAGRGNMSEILNPFAVSLCRHIKSRG